MFKLENTWKFLNFQFLRNNYDYSTKTFMPDLWKKVMHRAFSNSWLFLVIFKANKSFRQSTLSFSKLTIIFRSLAPKRDVSSLDSPICMYVCASTITYKRARTPRNEYECELLVPRVPTRTYTRRAFPPSLLLSSGRSVRRHLDLSLTHQLCAFAGADRRGTRPRGNNAAFALPQKHEFSLQLSVNCPLAHLSTKLIF